MVLNLENFRRNSVGISRTLQHVEKLKFQNSLRISENLQMFYVWEISVKILVAKLISEIGQQVQSDFSILVIQFSRFIERVGL